MQQRVHRLTTPVYSAEPAELERLLSDATSELALALGLVRVLTLLPLYDHSLDEIERQLAHALEQVRQARVLLTSDAAEGETTDRHSSTGSSRGGCDREA